MADTCKVCGRPGKKLPGGAHKSCAGKQIAAARPWTFQSGRAEVVPARVGARSARVMRTEGPSWEERDEANRQYDMKKRREAAERAANMSPAERALLEELWELTPEKYREISKGERSILMEKSSGDESYLDMGEIGKLSGKVLKKSVERARKGKPPLIIHLDYGRGRFTD